MPSKDARLKSHSASDLHRERKENTIKCRKLSSVGVTIAITWALNAIPCISHVYTMQYYYRNFGKKWSFNPDGACDFTENKVTQGVMHIGCLYIACFLADIVLGSAFSFIMDADFKVRLNRRYFLRFWCTLYFLLMVIMAIHWTWQYAARRRFQYPEIFGMVVLMIKIPLIGFVVYEYIPMRRRPSDSQVNPERTSNVFEGEGDDCQVDSSKTNQSLIEL